MHIPDTCALTVREFGNDYFTGLKPDFITLFEINKITLDNSQIDGSLNITLII